MSTTENPTVTIAPGIEMPLVGLGTWQANGSRAYAAVRRALDVVTSFMTPALPPLRRNELPVAIARASHANGARRRSGA